MNPMNHFSSSVSRSIRTFAAVLAFAGAALLTGCGVSAPVAHVSEGQALSGIVHGGQQPVSGASIQLYAAGSTGDGSAATGLLKAAVVTDSYGNFSITNDYTCPVSNPEVYLVATGGNPGLTPGTNNTAIAMMAALGNCSSLSQATYVYVDEVTTVGAIAALYPYMTSYANVGSSTADATAFANAAYAVSEFANTSNGTAPGPTLPAGYYASSVEINTIADILASCLNSAGGKSNDGSACGSLFFQTTPAFGVAPTDTIGATLNIIEGNYHSAAGVYALVPALGPFQPTLTAAPANWHLSIVPVPATPVLSLAAGPYTSVQTVSISEATSGATVYYTLDGSTPTAASTPYVTALTVSATETLNAVAIKTGYGSSAVASALYTINLTAATPTFYFNAAAPASFILSDTTPNAKIYYTVDNSTPTTSSALFSSSVVVTASETVKAFAVLAGYANSPVGTFSATLPTIPPLIVSAYCITTGCPASISLEGPITGAAVYYTLDGSTPTTKSTQLGGATYGGSSFGVTPYPGHPVTVSAFATAPYYTQSIVSSSTATYPAIGNFQVSPLGGTYTAPVTVKMYATDYSYLGYSIHYTLDGSTPTCASALYNGTSLAVNQSETVTAVACSGTYVNSSVLTAPFILNLPPAATPTISLAAGTYSTVQTVTLADTQASTSIYYTLDGSTPTTASTLYTGTAINISSTETLNAIAIATGYSSSPVATAAYVIHLAPVFSPAGGTYTSAQTVAITYATPNASIYYTTDGSIPNKSSTLYTSPITVGTSETINAYAVVAGASDSYVATAVYTINLYGVMNYIAGTGLTGYTGDNGPALSAEIYYPHVVAVDTNGNTFFADLPYGGSSAARVRKIDSKGVITTYAGNGTAGYTGEGTATSVELNGVVAMATDSAGNLYIADTSNHRIRKVTPAGIISTVAGTGTGGYSGEGLTATASKLYYPTGIAVDSLGNLYIVDSGNERIRKVVNGVMTTIAGTGTAGYTGTGGPAISAQIDATGEVAVDSNFNVYITESGYNSIRVISPTGTITQLATGIYSLASIAVDSSGNAYIATFGNNSGTVRKITPAGVISTVAGTGTTGSLGGTTGNGVPVLGYSLTVPRDVAIDPSGNLVIADSNVAYLLKATYQATQPQLPAPTIYPNTGTYASYSTTQNYIDVSYYTGVSGATIWCGPYGQHIGVCPSSITTISSNTTLTAYISAPGYADSPQTTSVVTIITNPVWYTYPNTYTTVQSVGMSFSAGSTGYYQINGGTAVPYTGPIPVSTTETITAYSVQNGVRSNTISGTFTINLPTALAPTFMTTPGTFTGTTQAYLTDGTLGASIYYTTDGSAPTTSSTLYVSNTPIQVAASETIKAVAGGTNFVTSSVTTGVYTIVAVAPAFSVGTGTYPTAQTVTLSTVTPGASIYYTTNGTTPSAASTLYVSGTPIQVAANETIEAITIATGLTSSVVSSAAYVIGLPQVAQPYISALYNDQFASAYYTISMTDATAGSAIYYTTDGSPPSVNSTRYSSSFILSPYTPVTIRAIAVATGYQNSVVSSNVVQYPQAYTPYISPGTGSYTTTQNVSISIPSGTAEQLIYTTDGSDPTTSGTRAFGYNGSAYVTVSATTTIKAYATGTYNTPSSVVTAVITITH